MSIIFPGEEANVATLTIPLPKAIHALQRSPFSLTTPIKYIPRLGDIVIGVITSKFSDEFKVDIHTYKEGHLPTTAFANATKQHYPNLEVGSVVLCGVSGYHPDYDTSLTCLAAEDPKGWSTKETYLGELRDGCFIDVPSYYSDILLGSNNSLMELIGEKVACEIVVGKNGRVWASAKTPRETIAILRLIEKGMKISSFIELQEEVESSLLRANCDVIEIDSDSERKKNTEINK